MKPLVKKMLTVVLCASTLTAPLFLTGCSVSKVANSVQQGVQKKSQDDVKCLTTTLKPLAILTVIQCALAMLSAQTFKN